MNNSANEQLRSPEIGVCVGRACVPESVEGAGEGEWGLSRESLTNT